MKNTIRIFIADFVPLLNKGEEAIVRGIEDLLGRGKSVELGLFDNVKTVAKQGNITVFPRNWVYRISGSDMSAKMRFIRNIGITVLLRLRQYGKLRNLTGHGGQQYQELSDFFKNSDYILVGHNGVFCPESCGIIHLAKKKHKRVGILGAGVRQYPYISWLISPLYRKALKESDFCVFRERSAYELMSRMTKDTAKIRLEPDPAFAMNPKSVEEVQNYLNSMNWHGQARLEGKLMIGTSVCQKAVLLRRSFPEVTEKAEKQMLHCQYLAKIFDGIIKERNAFLIFLPHSIEKGARNDVKTSYDVVRLMKSSSESYVVIDDDLSARTLKGIIQACDFFIGERAHSLIGSVSVATPFVGLTSSNDKRTHDIIGDMCGYESLLVDIDKNNAQSAKTKIFSALDSRQHINKRLLETKKTLKARLDMVASFVISG